ncbi:MULTISPECIES: arginine--tRNA ligase [unclassified Tatumella]|uniref:arginine--tRNA ligase n=1 Tax=unclassified Tatumella TaxID=2649542 RepID=UPI001BAFC927|nr:MULTISPECIES: arginine--tRNA ligase [unclassified Tatumella]MBS0876971.1 arginine--tRNA ligase [Tatumella sp. JGM82]MBS0890892.1 arginine--tRNA ligase [Tatumella sp. JGM94]MBS0901863.1 arginine--tRNA ligase [Tatumella sp. JGM100]
MDIKYILAEKVRQAMTQCHITTDKPVSARPSARPEYGDYQIDSMMAIAKSQATDPLKLAQRVAGELMNNSQYRHIIARAEAVHPGFINLFLNDRWLLEQAELAFNDPRSGVARQPAQHVVVDYSSPNVAKEMHVGHLRSTIIGDASVRTLEFLGHKVTRVNHIGDWGTQFGMLITYLELAENDGNISLSDLEGFYRAAKKRYDEDPAFALKARSYVVKLQQGDEYCRRMWHKLVDISMAQNQKNYDRLGVSLQRKDIRGESAYNDMLPEIVDDLLERGIATAEQETVMVFLDSYRNKQGEPMGVIVRKQDGGYLYTTTDIACAKYRYQALHADRILYYIDARQHQHLMMAWEIVRRAGYVPPQVSLEHHKFGMMLDKEGKPFKTREGGTIRLAELLEEAVVRAHKLVSEKSPDLSAAELTELSEVIGIGAVKYADLSKNRITDYVFDWDTMLSFEGNTAPYIQYACARISSILRKAESSHPLATTLSGDLLFSSATERSLTVKLLQFEEALLAVAKEGMPNIMCNYLYELASLFSGFYASSPILSHDHPAERQSRLALAALTGRVLRQGMETLGLKAPQRM